MLNKNSYTTSNYDIQNLNSLRKDNKINLNLDIQRSYLWTEEKQQNLCDTLISGFRIPEVHAIINGGNFEIIDGKQRLTTIFNILDDKVLFKQNYIINISETEKEKIFKQKNCLKFSELPEEYQNKINFTEISVAKYTNLSEEDYAILFRKINSGEPLSKLAQGLSKNILIRTHYTNILLQHPIFKNFYLTTTESNSEDLELALIRYMGLRKYGSEKSLDTSVFPYEDFNIVELTKYCSELYDLLTKINDLSDFQNNSSKKTGFPLLLYLIKEFNLTEENIKKYIKIFSEKYSSKLDENRNFNQAKIKLIQNYGKMWLSDMQGEEKYVE